MAVTDPGFSTRGAQSRGLGQNLLFGKIIAKKVHGTEEIGPKEGRASLFVSDQMNSINSTQFLVE